MQIAMIGQKGIPAHSGGVEQHVDVLSRELTRRGHDVLVYCRRSYCGADTVAWSEPPWRVFRPSIATKHLDAITHTFASTIDIVLRRADVVHFHAIGPAALAPLARLAGLPVVVTVHGLDWQRAKWGGFARRCLRFGERLAAYSASRLIVVSPTLCGYFQRQYGVRPRFIPNGVMPLTRRAPDEIRRAGLVPGRYLLAVARPVPEKGLHHLVEAFNGLPVGDVTLAIAGGGGLDADYERQLCRNAGPRVRFLGPANRELLAELYSHALLFVLPSEIEGMSLALLEAMSMECPVLVSDIEENTAVVGESGFTFRTGDVPNLRHVLQELLDVPEVLASVGIRGAAQVASYQWPTVATDLEEVYSEVTGLGVSTVKADSRSSYRATEVGEGTEVREATGVREAGEVVEAVKV